MQADSLLSEPPGKPWEGRWCSYKREERERKRGRERKKERRERERERREREKERREREKRERKREERPPALWLFFLLVFSPPPGSALCKLG